MDKKTVRFINFAVACMLVVCCLWQLLEKLFYGDVQPRLVDDLIYLLWAGTVFYSYYKGRKDQEEQEIQDQKDIKNQIE